MYSLFATGFDRFRNRPDARFHARSHCRGHAQRAMNFAEVVIREIQRNRSLKVFKLFAECLRQPGQPAAVHPQRELLAFDMRSANLGNIRHPGHNCLFGADDFRRGIPTRRLFVEVDDCEQVRLDTKNLACGGKWR